MEKLLLRSLNHCRGCSPLIAPQSNNLLLKCCKSQYGTSVMARGLTISPFQLPRTSLLQIQRGKNSCLKVTQAARQFASQAKKASGGYKMPWWQRLLLVGTFAGTGYYVYETALFEKDLENEKVRYKEFAKANLGGDWTLTDHHGNVRSSSVFRGQWLLIYFGFTHCPDICPEELEKLATLVKMIDEDHLLPNMQPLFISLDPERDTPTAIKDYLKDFKNPRMIGFTGSLEDIRKVAKQFRAYFGKGPADADNDYIVDHTIIIYLVNPDGQFVNYFDRSHSAESIKKSVTRHVQLYDELQKRKKQ